MAMFVVDRVGPYYKIMHRWVIILLLQAIVPSKAYGAASTIKVQFPLSVYGKPDFESPVLFTVERGATVLVSDKPYGGFRKIKTTVLGKARLGFVPANDLSAQKLPPRNRLSAIGGGVAYSRLTQGSKTFTTADQVNYSISGYSGQTINPTFTYQKGQQSFWRVYGMYRLVNLNGTAKSDIAGVPQQDVKIEYTMIALGGQMAWGLFGKYWYGGFGAEIAKSTSGKVLFGNQDLSGDVENPDYMSGHGMSGLQLRMGDKYSMFVEARLGVVSNQDPVLTVVELVANFMYWL